MLRHVLCVLALALCCCTTLCAALSGDGATEEAAAVQLVDGGAKIALTGKIDDSKCTAASPPAPGETKDVTISTTVTLKESATQETTQTANGPSKAVKVPAGYSIALNTSREVKCTKKAGTTSNAAEENCPAAETTDTNSITYVVTVMSTSSDQPAVKIPESQKYEVKVPAGHDVKIIENVVATCSPPATSASPPSQQPKVIPDPQGKRLADSGLPKVGPTSPESPPLDGQPITTEGNNRETQEGAELQRDSTKSLDTATSREKLNGARTGGEKGSDASNKVTPPTSSEAEGTETDNSVTVSDA
ncbi:hypothetical protein DQ04_10571030, partial [Trypanosoma grayi]|uniref:hypothetical protein n=1 Tax=Trypanosoma grayi TaxID=71804 RepID=UPI0004F420E2